MKKRNIIIGTILLITIIIGGIVFLIQDEDIVHNYKKEKPIKNEYDKWNIMVISNNDGNVVVQDANNIIYTIKASNLNVDSGTNVILEYAGIIDSTEAIQKVSIMDYSVVSEKDSKNVPDVWNDKGIFSDYYKMAKQKLDTLTLDQKIGQLFLVRYEDYIVNDAKSKNFGGLLFFGKDFSGKSKNQTINMINNAQNGMTIPLLTAVDEEGGTVVRVSSNPNLVSERFKSSQDLYNIGGFEKIKEDTIYKSEVLKGLGLNLNLAPVVDVSTDPNDYMYYRSFGKNTDLTSQYAKTVIEASKGTGVSYTLKHFPGYGNNVDTHTGASFDNRSLENIKNNDLPPFKAGINAGAEAVLVSHNIVNNIDSSNPASLSPSVHNVLRDDLGFTGIIMTDDISMQALDSVSDSTVKAILAGNDLIITTDYNRSINEVKNALNNNTLSEELIDKLAFRILAWKYYKGLMYNDYK